jgi:hypothetical protein
MSCVNRFYNALQERGDCQTPRKSYKATRIVGWIVSWKNHRVPFVETPPFANIP